MSYLSPGHPRRVAVKVAAVVGALVLIVLATIVLANRGHLPFGNHDAEPAQPTGTAPSSLGLGLGSASAQASGPGTSAQPPRAVLTVRSSVSPIAIKYAFRTRKGLHSKALFASTTTWRAASRVTGAEPLAAVIAQVRTGTVSCAVRIDGRRIDHKTASGDFATVACYG